MPKHSPAAPVRKKKPVREMSFPAQVAEMAQLGVESIARKIKRSRVPVHQTQTYSEIEDEAATGRRRKNQSADW